MAFKDDLKNSVKVETDDALEAAVFEGEAAQMPPDPGSNVVNLSVERLIRKAPASCEQVSVRELLELALAELSDNAVKCYLTIIEKDPEGGFSLDNYRSGLLRSEEIAYRQMGVLEAMENWKCSDGS